MRAAPLACIAAAAIAATLLFGCGRQIRRIVAPAEAPVIRLTVTALPSSSPDSLRYRVAWAVSPNSGLRADRFLCALDPPAGNSIGASWTTTAARERIVTIARPRPDSLSAAATRPHVFAVRGVDSYGRWTAPVSAQLVEYGPGPYVRIIAPTPSQLIIPSVPPDITIRWYSSSFVGQTYDPAVKIKFRLYLWSDVPISWLQYPDSMRAAVTPEFAGWDSVSAESTSVHFTNLTLNSEYLFVVVAFDAAGAYDTTWSYDSNMLRMFVQDACSLGPKLTFFNEDFNCTYSAGGCRMDPQQYPSFEFPADRAITIRWSASTQPGAAVGRSRWALDMADPHDETPRSNEETDLAHWSAWYGTNRNWVTLGPFDASGLKRKTHTLFVEVDDSNGMRTVCGIHLVVSRFVVTNDLLIVDDTRLTPDFRAVGDSMRAPTGSWPTAAELDTFLYACGGVRWRSTPDGTLSSPGIFKGYHYDTLGTRFSAGYIVPLEVLARYRYLIWYTDQVSAQYYRTSGPQPITALRNTTSRNQEDVLAAYVHRGGKLWLLGGGAGYAGTINWNNTGNDAGALAVFSSTFPAAPELQTGRLMFDLARWRSEFKAANTGSLPQLTRVAHIPAGWQGAPDYSLLPATLEAKTPATDPAPPFRNNSSFYASTYQRQLEYLSLGNSILESITSASGSRQFGPGLDTLFAASATGLPEAPAVNACMTYYHGFEGYPVVFSGFNIWNFQRPECIGVVDFVLQQLWGLPRDPVPR